MYHCSTADQPSTKRKTPGTRRLSNISNIGAKACRPKSTKTKIHAIGKSGDKDITGTRVARHQMVQPGGSLIAPSRRGFLKHLIQGKNATSRVLRSSSQMQGGIAVRSAKFDQCLRPLVNRDETQIMCYLWADRLEA